MKRLAGLTRNRRRGAALIIALVIMSVIACLATTNALVLARLRRFLNQVEQHQVQKFQRSPPHESLDRSRRP